MKREGGCKEGVYLLLIGGGEGSAGGSSLPSLSRL